MRRWVLFFYTFLLLQTSCDNDSNLNDSKLSSRVFSEYWLGMNKNYVYWDIDSTKWDATFRRYSPLFDDLDFQSQNDLTIAAQYFEEISSTLVDSHYTIEFSYPGLVNTVINPSVKRKELDLSIGRKNYLEVDTLYLDDGYRIGSSQNNNQASQTTVTSGTINGTILYFSCNLFSLYKIFNNPIESEAKDAIRFFIDKLDEAEALIIDLRGNMGGELVDLNFIVGQLIDKPLHFGYTKYKNGNGRLDYTPWVKSYVNPYPGSKAFNRPIIVLTDSFSASLSEAFAMAIHSIPNSKLVGETTWGATSPVTINELYNSGPFEIPNFMRVRQSSAMFKYLDGRIYESIGFPPDVSVQLDPILFNDKIDTQLEMALLLLN